MRNSKIFSVRNLTKVDTNISAYHKERLQAISKSRDIPMSRLIGFLIDTELQKENPFDVDIALPIKNYSGYRHLAEIAKIVNYMREKMTLETGLDVLILLRNEIGIPDKNLFLAAFAECLNGKQVEAFKPRAKLKGAPYPKNYVHYRLVGLDPKYKKYLRLKKEFESE